MTRLMSDMNGKYFSMVVSFLVLLSGMVLVVYRLGAILYAYVFDGIGLEQIVSDNLFDIIVLEFVIRLVNKIFRPLSWEEYDECQEETEKAIVVRARNVLKNAWRVFDISVVCLTVIFLGMAFILSKESGKPMKDYLSMTFKN